MRVPSWPTIVGLVSGFGDRRTAPPQSLVRVRQVHGSRVVVGDTLQPGRRADLAADAIVTTRAGVLVGVETADCVPILLVASDMDSDGLRWAAAVHAGWRGSVANVVGAAVEDARSRGHAASALLAAAGPSIGPCCYEVDDDVASHFRRAQLPVVADGRKPRLDLRSINRELLMRAGLPAENIQVDAPCTRCEAQRYHSYRAAGAAAGRQISWIGWAGPLYSGGPSRSGA